MQHETEHKEFKKSLAEQSGMPKILHYLMPSLEQGLIEMTLPDKPRSRLQKYRLTAAGKAAIEKGGV